MKSVTVVLTCLMASRLNQYALSAQVSRCLPLKRLRWLCSGFLRGLIAFLLALAVSVLWVSNTDAAGGSEPETATPEILTVGIVADNEPYSSAEGQIPRGFSVDVLNKLGETLNIRFDYRVGSWPDIYAAFLRGELDIIDEISWREDRAEKIFFTQPYHLRQTVVMQQKASPLPQINQVSDLKPYRIGIMRDIYYRDFLRQQGVQVIEYDLLPNLVQALAFGWVDAIIGPEITLNYMARRDGFFQLETNAAAPLEGMEIEDFRLGVLKNRPELFSQLQKAMNSLSPAWLQELNQRWMEYGGQFALREKNLQLTPQQSLYLKKLPPLRVGLMRDYTPFSFSESGKIQGLSVDILNRLQDITGVKFIPVVDQWSNLLELFKQGELDLIANISDLPERRAFTLFSQPYHRIPNVAFTRNSNLRLNKPSDLSGLRIALGSDVFYESTIRRLFQDQVVSFTEQAAMFKALANHQVDLVLTALPNGNHWIRELGLTDVWIAGELQLPGLTGEDLRLGLQPHLEPLRDILDQALSGISQTEKRTIENRWLGARTANENEQRARLNPQEQAFLQAKGYSLSYCIHPDRYPFEHLSRQGVHEGMSASLLTTLQNKLDTLNFVLYPTDSWAESLSALQQGKCDLLPMTIANETLEQGLLFSGSWYNASNVILGSLDAPFIERLSELKGQALGISQDNELIELLKQNYPDLNLIPVKSMKDGISQVRKKQLYGFIGGLADTSHLLQRESMGDIRVLGRLPMDSNYSVAVSEETPQLKAIIDKLLQSLNRQELAEIENNWLSIRLEQQTDYRLLWQLITAFALLFVALFFWNRKLGALNQKLKAANERLAYLSITDPLTGLSNRIYLDQVFPRMLDHCRQNDHLLAITLVDADHFKQINDTYGHNTGDICLKQLSAVMLATFNQSNDHLIRFGGEEFIILTSGPSQETICQRLEQFRIRISQQQLTTEQGALCFTISLGAKIQQATDSDLDNWLKQADKALYNAKNSGRNQLVIS